MELAFILPVLLLLVLGIINFGYVFGQKLALNQAVREGTRLAVVDKSADSTTIEVYVEDSTGGLISPKTAVGVISDVSDPTTGTFTATGTADCEDNTKLGGQLRVEATYQPPSWLVPLPLGLTPPKLTSVAVFRCEVV